MLEAQIEGVDQSLSASIAEVARVSADADAVMTEKLNQQQSTMQTADAELSSRINEEATTRADAVESLASQIQQVTADYKGADNQLQGQITTESKARADADSAMGIKSIPSQRWRTVRIKHGVNQLPQAPEWVPVTCGLMPATITVRIGTVAPPGWRRMTHE